MSNDAWDIGTLHKPAIWAFYASSNILGVLCCALLCCAVYRNKQRRNEDVFIAGVASGCMTLSITCGVQCICNAVAGRFYGGVAACQAEAIAHISSILTEFFCTACISLDVFFHMIVLKSSSRLPKHYAECTVLTIWCLCLLVTGLASLVSPIYLMSAGTYCFFGFGSFAIAGWLVPGLLLSLASMLYCHVRIVKHLTQHCRSVAVAGAASNTARLTEAEVWQLHLRWRSTLFMLLLIAGWGFAAVATIDELAVGRASEWLVTAVGVGGVSFSWAAPLLYAVTTPEYRALLPSRVHQRGGSTLGSTLGSAGSL
jgi:hypothetical protein